MTPLFFSGINFEDLPNCDSAALQIYSDPVLSQ
jgi:hypothetical protein